MYVIKKIIFTQNSGIRIRNTVQTLSSPSYVLSPPPPPLAGEVIQIIESFIL